MSKYNKLMEGVDSKREVEDTTLHAKDTKKKRGQGHKKKLRPRTDFPRTDHLEAKDRNAQSQGPRTLCASVIQEKKKKKGLRQKFAIFSQNFRR